MKVNSYKFIHTPYNYGGWLHFTIMKYNSCASDKLFKWVKIYVPITGTSALDFLRDQIEWFMTKGSRVYIAKIVTFSSLWIGSCDDTSSTVRIWTEITKWYVNCVLTWMFHSCGRCEQISINRFWGYKAPL